jgi:hypothetical protein
MTGGVPEDDIALRVLQVFVQAPPLLLSTANHSFTNDVHREHVPQRVQAAPRVDIEWVWLCGYTVQVAVLVSAKERRHEALASGYERALCY